MASTGEVACFGVDRHEAFLKALLSTGFRMPQTGILISAQDSMLEDIVHVAYELGKLGFDLYATQKTHAHLISRGVASALLHFPSEGVSPDVVEHLREKKIDLVINLPTADSIMLADNYVIRRTAVDLAIPLLTNLSVVQLFTEAMARYKKKDLLGLIPDSLFDYYAIEPSEEAWTGPNEFH
jgi:carbamoyl-phosphate synthase (ammonia)